jgi:hypothetical protein
MVLMAVYNSEGLVGRCDANCFNAHLPECDCICGGANHGVGERVAVSQTTTRAQTWIARFIAEKKVSGADTEVFGVATTQPSLFG